MASRSEELQHKAETLRRRLLLDDLGLSVSSDFELPHLFERLHLVRDEIIQLHEDVKRVAKKSVAVHDDPSLAVLLESELTLTAELRLENYVKWTGCPPDPVLLVELLKNYIKQSVECHEDELERKQQKIAKLQEQIERWKFVIHQEQQLMESFTNEAQSRAAAQQAGGVSRHLQESTAKLKEEKSLRKQVLRHLTAFLDEHYRQLDEDDLRAYSTKFGYQLPEPIDRLKSVSEILELLLNRSLANHADRWIAVDETFWPPYLELLLRYRIIVYHWDNCNIIRLEIT